MFQVPLRMFCCTEKSTIYIKYGCSTCQAQTNKVLAGLLQNKTMKLNSCSPVYNCLQHKLWHVLRSIWCMSTAAWKKSSEELPEFSVEDSVDNWVQCTVHVTQPCHCAHQVWRDVTGFTQGSCSVNYKKRSPAEEEDTCGKITHHVSYSLTN